MAKTTIDTWNPQCLQAPLFAPIAHLSPYIERHPRWPSLSDYQQILATNGSLHNTNQQRIAFVAQTDRTACFEEQYENRIYLSGEVQTRLENWHDFFQVLVWQSFPKTKINLNACHYHAALSRQQQTLNKNRSSIENAITLFDECGAIIITDKPELLTLIQHHHWKELFWTRRADIALHLKCIVFGHALYEKALNPYIGMTAHCVLLTCDAITLTLNAEALNTYCDEQVAQHFIPLAPQIRAPKALSPFPILGMPGWHKENNQESFYDNTQYFRPKRTA